MFNINNIYPNTSNSTYLCNCKCSSSNEAIGIMGSFLISLKERYPLANLRVEGSTLILDTPKLEKTKELAELLNNSIENMH